MYSFANDYSEGACKKILEALIKTNFDQSVGYGLDEYSKRAQDKIRKLVADESVDVHFVVGGTQANIISIAAALRPFEAVMAVDSGHINVHETGAIEATGHKVLTMRGANGKVLPEEVEEVVRLHSDEHMVHPKMVFISNSTEIGTIYTLDELKALRAVCDKHNLYLYLDGARLGSALMSDENDLTLKDINDLCDLFYIGGTKNGALFGEAIVIKNEALKENFRFLIKQRGAMLAKGRLLGLQFDVLFTDDLFFKHAKHANQMAAKLQNKLKEKNIPLFIESPTNQIFPIFKNEDLAKIQEEFIVTVWEKVDPYHTVVRLVCSWATKNEEVEHFNALIDQMN